jgi:putative SOS response-associated peptidase YedK
MCGRFVVSKTKEELQAIFEIEDFEGSLEIPSYNIAPTQNIAMLAKGAFHVARWGFVSSTAKSPEDSPLIINARIETIQEKPSFSESFKAKRTMIPASGYYEWQTTGTEKTPYYITAGIDGVLAFAGIYEWWLDKTKPDTDPSRWLLSVAILTMDASPELSHIHDRTPVLLSPATLDQWIDSDFQGDADLIKEVKSESNRVAAELEFYQVSNEVGNVRNNSPSLIQPLS